MFPGEQGSCGEKTQKSHSFVYCGVGCATRCQKECVCVWGPGLEAKGEVRQREDNHITLYLVAMVRELGSLKAQPWKGMGPGGTSWSLWFRVYSKRKLDQWGPPLLCHIFI